MMRPFFHTPRTTLTWATLEEWLDRAPTIGTVIDDSDRQRADMKLGLQVVIRRSRAGS